MPLPSEGINLILAADGSRCPDLIWYPETEASEYCLTRVCSTAGTPEWESVTGLSYCRTAFDLLDIIYLGLVTRKKCKPLRGLV